MDLKQLEVLKYIVKKLEDSILARDSYDKTIEEFREERDKETDVKKIESSQGWLNHSIGVQRSLNDEIEEFINDIKKII